MNFKCKCMFLGKEEGKTKDGNIYKRIKFLDKDSQDTVVVYCNDFGAFNNLKPYTDCEVDFQVYKDSKGFYRISLGA